MLTGNIPFKEVLINGQVLGPDGTRMSKSKGNVVNPLDRVDEFGADAIRLTLLDARIGDDFPFKWETVKAKKLLLQKLWNAGRLSYPFIGKKKFEKPLTLNSIDQWILAEHKRFIEKVISAYDNYDFYTVVESLYSYFWETIADEYLELIKHRLFEEDQSALYTLQRIFRDLLIILHPLAPHITEEMYSKLFGDKISILLERIPDVSDIEEDPEILKLGEYIKKTTSTIRTLKIKNQLSIVSMINVKLVGPKEFIEKIRSIESDIKKTLKIESIEYQEGDEIKAELLSIVKK